MSAAPPRPVSPAWLRPVVIGVVLFVWAAVAWLAFRGEAWREAAGFAAFATLGLTGVDFATRRRPG